MTIGTSSGENFENSFEALRPKAEEMLRHSMEGSSWITDQAGSGPLPGIGQGNIKDAMQQTQQISDEVPRQAMTDAFDVAAQRASAGVKGRQQEPVQDQIDMPKFLQEMRRHLVPDQGHSFDDAVNMAYWGMGVNPAKFVNPAVAYPKTTTAKVAAALSVIPTEAKGASGLNAKKRPRGPH